MGLSIYEIYVLFTLKDWFALEFCLEFIWEGNGSGKGWEKGEEHEGVMISYPSRHLENDLQRLENWLSDNNHPDGN